MKLSDRVTEVKYLGKNGTAFDKEFANKHLIAGEIYKVSDLDIGRSSSKVYLKTFGSHAFNTVMFEEVHETELDLYELLEEIALYCKNNKNTIADFITILQESDFDDVK